MPWARPEEGAAGPEKVKETSPPPLRPEPGLELEGKPWREVVENVDFRTRANHSLCDFSQAPSTLYALVSSSVKWAYNKIYLIGLLRLQ